MIRIIHAADLHLDSPFSALPPDKARQRRRESREIPNRLADLAIRRQADLVLLAGDLFDGARVYPETLEMLRAALERMPGRMQPPRSVQSLSTTAIVVTVPASTRINGAPYSARAAAVSATRSAPS